MRNFSKFVLMTFALAMFFGVSGTGETYAQGPKNEIFKRMEAHAKALSSLRSEITMSQHDSTLDDYDVKKGIVSYLPGKGKDVFMRIDWIRPASETLVVGNGEYVLYTPGIKQAIKGKTSDANKGKRSSSGFEFLSMSKSQLNANYATEYLGIEKVGGKDMWRLKMNPKKQTSYKYAELWVDGNGMPIQSKIYEKNGDSTTVMLENIQKNVTIDGNLFRLKLPSGTKVIDS